LGVVDANAIIASVDNDRRSGRRSRMLEGTVFSALPLFASTHVYWEVYRRMPKVARSSPVPLEELIAHFEAEYLPVLRFVDVDMSSPFPSVERVSDPDDQPTAQLAYLLAPVVVLSEDKHLRRPGIAPPNWREAAGRAPAIARATGQQTGMSASVVLPIWGAWKGSAAIAHRLELPRGSALVLLAALAAGATAYVRRMPERKAMAKDVLIAMLEEFGKQAEIITTEGAALREVALARLPSATAEARVASMLARSKDPLLTREIASRMEYEAPGEALTEREVRDILQSSPEFVRNGRYRWQVGYEAAPNDRPIPEK
jgi:hypothetical protein